MNTLVYIVVGFIVIVAVGRWLLSAVDSTDSFHNRHTRRARRPF